MIERYHRGGLLLCSQPCDHRSNNGKALFKFAVDLVTLLIGAEGARGTERGGSRVALERKKQQTSKANGKNNPPIEKFKKPVYPALFFR
ncbi:hypothetical protein E4665_15535 [Sporolactobacillus shoreae]|uniref:Uncharacterized protein n=1 Tax=Sporolactobacillus shoreae TaxID=1465501 RepID=A0A4Z0GL40_9BACL|nr:hypothetical protein [Sporolactobacillus shoreae]TGA96483.1 hypothetical protein E4665_15535 [Sporolactobacillus shoreae]